MVEFDLSAVLGFHKEELEEVAGGKACLGCSAGSAAA